MGGVAGKQGPADVMCGQLPPVYGELELARDCSQPRLSGLQRFLSRGDGAFISTRTRVIEFTLELGYRVSELTEEA